MFGETTTLPNLRNRLVLASPVNLTRRTPSQLHTLSDREQLIPLDGSFFFVMTSSDVLYPPGPPLCSFVFYLLVSQFPLHQAALVGQHDVFEELVAHNFPINERDDMGWTALHWAATGQSIEVRAGARNPFEKRVPGAVSDPLGTHATVEPVH